MALTHIHAARRPWLALLASLALVFFTAQADAQERGRAVSATPSAAPAGYDEVIALALREFELENYGEARAGFLRAHQMYPNARTLRALGLVAYEMKNYTACIDYLVGALDSSERPLTDEQRSEVRGTLERARRYVGRFRVFLRPEAAALLVDGELTKLPADGLLALGVGDHVIEAEAQGYYPLRRSLQVTGDTERELELSLRPVTSGAELSKGTLHRNESAPNDARSVRRRRWLWGTLGVALAAGAAVGLIVGLRRPEAEEPGGGTTNAVLRLPPPP